MPDALTAEEQSSVLFHLNYEQTEPYTYYVQVYVMPAMARVSANAAAVSAVRARLAECESAWLKYTKSLTKQELDGVGPVKFSGNGELRLLKTHRIFAANLARALGIKSNYLINNGGLKYR